MKWQFSIEGDKVALRARLEGPNGMIGDAREEIGPGEKFLGVSYEEFKKAKGGTLKVEGSTGTISKGDEPEDELDTSDLDDIEELIT